MPVQQTNYAARFRLPDLLQQGQAGTLECPVYLDASLSAPTAAGSTCTIYRPDGSTYSTGAITVSSSVATYAYLAPGTTETLGLGWRVEWSLIMGDSRTYVYRNSAGLVLRQLYPVLTDLDLTQGRYSDLSLALPQGSSSWQEWRTAAWEEIQRTLLRDQRRPWLITEPSALLDVHRELTYAHIFRALGQRQRSGERNWLDLAQDHQESFRRGWAQLSFDYASDETSATSSTVRRAARPVITLCATGVPRP
jgi:hypothetical protein